MWSKLSINQLSKDPYNYGIYDFSYAEKRFSQIINNINCGIFVAINNDSTDILGFIEVWIRDKDFYFYPDDYGYVMHSYVDKESRNYNISYELYKSAEDWTISKGKNYLVADVYSHNIRVIKLLKFFGMKEYQVKFAKSLGNSNV
jgi:Acetyltransferases